MNSFELNSCLALACSSLVRIRSPFPHPHMRQLVGDDWEIGESVVQMTYCRPCTKVLFYDLEKMLKKIRSGLPSINLAFIIEHFQASPVSSKMGFRRTLDLPEIETKTETFSKRRAREAYILPLPAPFWILHHLVGSRFDDQG